MSPSDRLDLSVQRIQAAFDLAVERFDKDPAWRRHLPATRLEIAGLVAEASRALRDMAALEAAKDDAARLRTQLSVFRTAYSNHQVHFLASSTENAADYGTSLGHVLQAFAGFSEAVKRTTARVK